MHLDLMFGIGIWVFWGCLKRPFAVDGFQAMDCSAAEISGAFGSTAEATGFPMGHPLLGTWIQGIYGNIWEIWE